MGSRQDVALDKANGQITNEEDSRVGWDFKTGQYFLKNDVTGDEELNENGKRIVLVFVGASLGPVHRKGVLHTRINPAAVRVGEGETLRWIIEDTHEQKDTSEIQIIFDPNAPNAFWPFDGPSPDQDPEQFKSLRGKKNGKGKEFAETVGGRKPHPNGGTNPPNRRSKYSILITFKEDPDNANLEPLTALIDPDVVYNPPGF